MPIPGSKRFVAYMTALGFVAHKWTELEHYYDSLIGRYLDGPSVSHLVTGRLSAQAKTDLLLELCEYYENERKVIGLIKSAAKGYERCRENRNVIFHSSIIFYRKATPYYFKRSKQKPNNLSQFHITARDLLSFGRRMDDIAMFISDLDYWIWERERHQIAGRERIVSLPEKPLLPKKLSPLLPANPLTGSRQPQSSEA